MSSSSLDEQRLARYGLETSTYSLPIVTDEDQASQLELEDVQIAWQSRLRYDRMHRQVDSTTGKLVIPLNKYRNQKGDKIN